MKKFAASFSVLLLFTFISFSVIASDFEWLDNLSVTARADSSGYQLKLATRFHLGDAEVKAVIGKVDDPSDAYMVFRLSEMSHQPVNEVLKQYHVNKGKGWGVIAKRLGIRPGSQEFKLLKTRHDLGDDMNGGHGHPHEGHGMNRHKS